MQKLSGHMNLDFGNQFLIHMLRLPISFFDQRSAGDLVSRMDNNSEINSMGKFFFVLLPVSPGLLSGPP